MYRDKAHDKVRELLNPEDVRRFDFLISSLDNSKELRPDKFVSYDGEFKDLLKRNEIVAVPQPNTIPKIVLVFHKGELLG